MKSRPITGCLRPAALAAALLFASGPSLFAAEWQLVFSVHEDLQAWTAPTDPAKIETGSYTQTVALGATYLVVQDDRLKKIIDFAERRSRQVRIGDSPLNAWWPLYGEVGNLEDEAKNRIALGSAMRAGKVTQALPIFDRFEIETTLRMGAQNAPTPSATC